MSRLLSHALNITRAFVGQFTQNTQRFQTIFPRVPTDTYVSPSVPGGWLVNIIRETHYKFIPKESYRVKKLGYYAKVKTRKGRKQIMRRILKGRFVITH